jgi:hypothetical protein
MAKKRSGINRSWMLLIVFGGLLVLTAGVLLLVNMNPGQPAETNQPPAGDPVAAVTRISLADAKSAFDRGNAVFLDVRTDQEYQQSHIAGATHIAYNELAQRLSELDPEAELITYCT